MAIKQYEHIYCKEIHKMESKEKWHYKLGEMEDELFSTWTPSFHLQTNQRIRRWTFTDGENAHFYPSLGFGPFSPPIQALLLSLRWSLFIGNFWLKTSTFLIMSESNTALSSHINSNCYFCLLVKLPRVLMWISPRSCTC